MATVHSNGFGEWLRRAREARGLTLEGIASQTKIPRRHLEALEHGNLGLLPTFYQRAEVRTFAQAVGVDEQLALAQLKSVVAPVELQREVPRAQSKRKPSTIFAALALGATILTAALLGRAMSEHAVASGLVAEPRGAATSQPAPAAPMHDPAATPATPREAPASLAQPSVVSVTPVSSDSSTELVVTTRPSGARVTVNGLGWGTSPVTIRHLPPGDKRIRVTKDGYAATERVLALDDGRRRALEISLTTAP